MVYIKPVRNQNIYIFQSLKDYKNGKNKHKHQRFKRYESKTKRDNNASNKPEQDHEEKL